MAYESLREWIAKLEEAGELKRIKAEVDWNEEIGGITRRVLNMKEQGPALLFENIKDHQNTHGKKLFTASLSTYGRIGLMLGLPKETPVRELIQTVRSRIKHPVKPYLVKDAPCKEHVEKDNDVNILEFPVPKWHWRDGGRYITTFAGVVTKDPETLWTNVGLYRGMVVDSKSIAAYIVSQKHWAQHYHEYKRLGKPMPVAIVYGWDPVLPFTACAPYRGAVSEYEIMGALRQKPVPLVQCESVDLEVPAEAEIVVEGTISFEEESYVMEGPFGEYPGYYGPAHVRPVIRLNCVTHRDDPILQGTLEGPTPNENSHCSSISLSALAWEALERTGIPGIKDVFCPPGASWGTNVRVQINKRYQGHAKQVAACLWGLTPTNFKNVVVVEEDIDIYDPDSVEWAIAYRVDPKEDLIVFPGLPGSSLDPCMAQPQWKEAAAFGGGRWNRLLIDATRTWRWGPREEWGGERFPLKVEISVETQKKVQDRWKEYGL
jgi:UbiD family decarboxylase